MRKKSKKAKAGREQAEVLAEYGKEEIRGHFRRVSIPEFVQAFLDGVDRVTRREGVQTACTRLENGVLELVLGDIYWAGSEWERLDVLRHEASHFLLQHLGRMQGRDPRLWNLVTDAALHETGCCLHHTSERGFVTFEMLGLPPMPPEVAYELLKERIDALRQQLREQGVSGGCGSAEGSAEDGSVGSAAKRMGTAGAMERAKDNPFRGAGRERGPEVRPPEELRAPRWVQKALSFLMEARGEAREPRRSWRRENRACRELPGYVDELAREALVLVDTSGSISDAQLAEFLEAVSATPELEGAEVVLFSSEARGPIRPSEVSRAQVERGGTLYGPPAAFRREDRPTIWLTDGMPCDAWPEPLGAELWVITENGQAPPGGRPFLRIGADDA